LTGRADYPRRFTRRHRPPARGAVVLHEPRAGFRQVVVV